MSQEAGLHNRSAASLGHPPHPCGFLYTRLWNRGAACPTVNRIGICFHPSQVSAFVPETSSPVGCGYPGLAPAHSWAHTPADRDNHTQSDAK